MGDGCCAPMYEGGGGGDGGGGIGRSSRERSRMLKEIGSYVVVHMRGVSAGGDVGRVRLVVAECKIRDRGRRDEIWQQYVATRICERRSRKTRLGFCGWTKGERSGDEGCLSQRGGGDVGKDE